MGPFTSGERLIRVNVTVTTSRMSPAKARKTLKQISALCPGTAERRYECAYGSSSNNHFKSFHTRGGTKCQLRHKFTPTHVSILASLDILLEANRWRCPLADCKYSWMICGNNGLIDSRIKRPSNMFKALKLASCSLGLCYVMSAAAAPNISQIGGSLEHLGQATIQGTGFGTRPDYNEGGHRWNGHRFIAFRAKDFSDQSLTSGGFRASVSGAWMIRPSDRTGSGFMATKFHNGQRLGALEATQHTTTGIVYSTFWIKLPTGTASDSSKFWRIYGNGSAQNIYLENYGSGGSWNIKGYSECADASCAAQTVWSSPQGISGGRWHRIETTLERDANGRFTVWMDGKLQWSRDRWVSSSFDGTGRTIDIGNLLSSASNNNPDNNSFNFDEVYHDFTRARVEIGNAPTWSQTTHREIQIPLQWASNTISVAVNRGSLPSGAPVYLYVVAPDGSVNSNGFPLTLGGSPDDGEKSPPQPPASVEVE